MERRRGWLVVGAAVLGLSVVGVGCANSGTGGAPEQLSVGAGTPGVTKTKIIVGALATESGPLASLFGQPVSGAEAYFDYVNHTFGGVDGRKIDLAYNLDDGGSTTNDTIQVRNLVEQDHVFAVVGVATPFFSGADFLAAQGTPTFGYVVTTDWNDRPTMFGAYGSYLDYTAGATVEGYPAEALHAKSVAVIAYNIEAASEDDCAAVADSLRKAGVKVGFEDLAFPYGGNPTADVLKMKAAHVDQYFSCIEGADNLAFAKTMNEYGMGSVTKVWLNGYDRSYLQQDPTDMVGTIYLLQNVPFEAASQFPGKYPAMAQYLAIMRKYAPQAVYSDVALQGYQNAVQFVVGLRQLAAAHLPLTQANLVKTINEETAFASGLTTPIDWKTAHDAADGPFCFSFVEVEPHDVLKVVFAKKDEVFVCRNAQGQLVSPPPGSPGL